VGISGDQQDSAYYIPSKKLLGPLGGDRKILKIKVFKVGNMDLILFCTGVAIKSGPQILVFLVGF